MRTTRTASTRAFWLKWLDDLADTQLPDGRFPLICPAHWRGTLVNESPEAYGMTDDWSVTHWPDVPVPDFATMRRGVEFLRTRTKEHIVSEGLSDHMEPQPGGTCSVMPHRTPVELTSTAWFFAVTTMVVGAAEVIGSADARGYRELAESIREAFNDRFFDVATASYATGSQTALENVLGEAGAAEVMYRIATQPTFPSWGQQVTRGATTV